MIKRVLLLALIVVATISCEKENLSDHSECYLVPNEVAPSTDLFVYIPKGMVTICHNGVTIQIDESALQTHLNHGDTLGECNTLGIEEIKGAIYMPNLNWDDEGDTVMLNGIEYIVKCQEPTDNNDWSESATLESSPGDPNNNCTNHPSYEPCTMACEPKDNECSCVIEEVIGSQGDVMFMIHPDMNCLVHSIDGKMQDSGFGEALTSRPGDPSSNCTNHPSYEKCTMSCAPVECVCPLDPDQLLDGSFAPDYILSPYCKAKH